VKRSRIIVVWSWLGLATLAHGAALEGPSTSEQRSFQGLAYDRKSGDFLYTEEHEQSWDGARLVSARVTYRAPDGQVMATKTLDFANGVEKPSFRMDDVRDGYVEGVTVGASEIALFQRDNARSELERSTMATPARLVVDAGFNYYLRSHWEALARGETLEFDFAAPTRLDTFRFQARRTGEKLVGARPAMVVAVELATPLVRWLLDPITLAYDTETRELLEWEGISNIDDDQDKPFDARIVFPRGEGSVPDTRAAAARAAGP
jgi:hypothetical protein